MQGPSWDPSSGLLGGLVGKLKGQVVPERHRTRDPPYIEAWVGSQPRSFPLQLKHASRCGARWAGVGRLGQAWGRLGISIFLQVVKGGCL